MSATASTPPPANAPPANNAAVTRVACDHCGLVVPEALVEASSEQQFCCGGCRVAYETIRACNLDEYYAIRDRLAGLGQPSTGVGGRYAGFDSEAFHQKYVKRAGEKLSSIELRLEGVHCAACVWLIEQLPRVAPGVAQARLSLAGAVTHLVWDPSVTPLSTIASSLDRLGYTPHPARDTTARDVRTANERSRLVRMAVAGALAGNNMLIALALYAGVFTGIDPQFSLLFRWLSMVIGWVSLMWPGWVFFRGAATAVRLRAANLDLPIAIALGIGGIAGTANVLLNRGEVYFDSLSVLVFLLLVGRYLQARQQRWAEDAVGLTLAATPDSCRIIREGHLVEDSVEALNVGDEIEVWAGELFPADGRVVEGSSAIDRAVLTGESQPIAIDVGNTVDAGAVNVASTLRVRVEATGDSTRISKLMQLVSAGLAAKPPIVQFADRVAGWFVLIVVTLAAANLAWWWTTTNLAAAIDSTVALLIVACPCALGLATPLTMAVAIGHGSKRGMLIKSAAVLEQLARVNRKSPGVLLIDKTGTLTTGQITLERWVGNDDLKPWVAAIEGESNHPLAAALQNACEVGNSADSQLLTNRQELPGRGVQADTPLGRMVVCSPRHARETGVEFGREYAQALRESQELGLTPVVVAIDGRTEAIACLADQPHADSLHNIAWLRRGGWETEILSGDHPGPVLRVADALKLPPSSAHGEVSPEEKLAYVQATRRRPTMMVGDGVNDAAALAAADIGVAVHGGAEASLAAADVYFTQTGVGKLVELVKLGRHTMRVVRRNLAISLAYNALAVALAAGGFITPLVAALLMPASSATVLASAVGFYRGAPAECRREV